MKSKIIIFSCLVFLLIIPLLALPALAKNSNVNQDNNTNQGNDANTNTSQVKSATALENPLGNVTSISQLYGRIIYAFLGLSGAVALIMFILGGFSWMTAGGNEEKVKKGRDTLIWATMGLVIIFSSYAVLRTIFETLNFK